MDLGLNNKVALVTAASKGIGRACAVTLAREGAKLAICARDAANIEAAARDIHAQTGAEVLAASADLARAEDIDAFVARTAERYGRIDILIAIAGQPKRGSFDETTDEILRQAFDLTILATVRLIRAVKPLMEAAGGGRVVTVQSRSAKEPIGRHVASNVTRPGVAGLFKDLSSSLAPSRISFNTVLPGRIDTDRFAEGAQQSPLGAEEYRRRMSTDIALKRFGRADEVADAVAFLASDRASYINGAVLQVDGGLMKTIL